MPHPARLTSPLDCAASTPVAADVRRRKGDIFAVKAMPLEG